jgi:hypothetical protein
VFVFEIFPENGSAFLVWFAFFNPKINIKNPVLRENGFISAFVGEPVDEPPFQGIVQSLVIVSNKVDV